MVPSCQGGEALTPAGEQASAWALWVRVQRFLCREADTVDMQRWSEWITLFADEVEYWVPAWESEFEITNNHNTEVSLVYLNGKDAIKDRLWRFTSGRSAASVPLPRTVHHVTNVEVIEATDEVVKVRTKWMTHAYRFKESLIFGGHCEYDLQIVQDSFLISRKKSILVNDRPVMAVDLYHF